MTGGTYDRTLRELRALSDLIHRSIEKIEHVCATSGSSLPSLHDPFNPDEEAIFADAQVQEQGAIAVAAASQLIAALRPPPVTLGIHALQVCSCFFVQYIRLTVSEVLCLLRIGCSDSPTCP